MAAPNPTPRLAPTGAKLKDGFSALITFGQATAIAFWEKGVTPPGIDGGDAIEQTTMHNVAWRTFSPRSLKTLTPCQSTVAYDPAVIAAIEAAINREDTITVEFSDGTAIAFYGFLKSFQPGDLKEGAQPEATIQIVPTNQDPNTGAEAGPVYDATPGT